MLKTMAIILVITFTESTASDLSSLYDEFSNTEVKGKYRIIDSLLASIEIPHKFFGKLLDTDDFKDSFPTFDVYWTLQSRTARKVVDISDPDITAILKKYYYSGRRSRHLNRPTTWMIKWHWQKEIARVVDKDGSIWAVTNIWWYGNREDLWLIHKKNESDSTWSGPWFTGISTAIPIDLNKYKANPKEIPINTFICSLEFINGKLHLIDEQRGIDKIISPEILTLDKDYDGLYDVEEERFTTDPDNDDTDGDGLLDGEDINPLAAPKTDLTDEDMIRLAMFRNCAWGNYPYTVFVIAADNENKLEYFTNSPNAIILSMNKPALDRYQAICGGAFYPSAGCAVQITKDRISDDCVNASFFSRDQGLLYEVERHNGIWVVGNNIGIIHY